MIDHALSLSLSNIRSTRVAQSLYTRGVAARSCSYIYRRVALGESETTLTLERRQSPSSSLSLSSKIQIATRKIELKGSRRAPNGIEVTERERERWNQETTLSPRSLDRAQPARLAHVYI